MRGAFLKQITTSSFSVSIDTEGSHVPCSRLAQDRLVLLVAHSKGQFESELHGARTTHLVEWTQDAQRTRQRARGLAECGLTEAGIDCPEVRVIEDVES